MFARRLARLTIRQLTTTQPQRRCLHRDPFNVSSMFTMNDLFEARVHYGHKEGTLNPHMAPYVFGSRLGHLIIDLDQTVERLKEALNFTAHIAYRDGIILLINTNRETSLMTENTAKECGEFAYCAQRWRRIFTNSTHLFKGVTRLPDLVIFMHAVDPAEPNNMTPAVADAAKLLIPTCGIVDTNCEPTLITYPVPGNDDTYVAQRLYHHLFKNAILKGKAKRKQDQIATAVN